MPHKEKCVSILYESSLGPEGEILKQFYQNNLRQPLPAPLILHHTQSSFDDALRRASTEIIMRNPALVITVGLKHSEIFIQERDAHNLTIPVIVVDTGLSLERVHALFATKHNVYSGIEADRADMSETYAAIRKLVPQARSLGLIETTTTAHAVYDQAAKELMQKAREDAASQVTIERLTIETEALAEDFESRLVTRLSDHSYDLFVVLEYSGFLAHIPSLLPVSSQTQTPIWSAWPTSIQRGFASFGYGASKSALGMAAHEVASLILTAQKEMSQIILPPLTLAREVYQNLRTL